MSYILYYSPSDPFYFATEEQYLATVCCTIANDVQFQLAAPGPLAAAAAAAAWLLEMCAPARSTHVTHTHTRMARRDFNARHSGDKNVVVYYWNKIFYGFGHIPLFG